MTLDRTTPPPVHMMGDLTLPAPHIEVLPNGITLYHIDGGTQEVNQLSIVWTGGLSEARIPSEARMTANMLREGTATMSGTEISEALDFNGAFLKTVSDSHNTIIDMSSLNSKTSQLMPIVSDILTSPSFPESTFINIRDIEVNNFRLSQSKVMTLCNQTLAPMIDGEGHPHARIPTVAEIESITAADMHSFYKSLYTTYGCRAYLSGRITDNIYTQVRTMLSELPVRRESMAMDIIPYKPEAPGYRETVKEGAVQAAVEIAIPAPMRQHPDYLPLRFTVMALGGYFGSRLMKNIREDKGYTYGIGAYLLGALEGSYVLITAQTDASYIDLLINEVTAELKRMSECPLSDDELIRLKQYSASTLMETLDSPFSIMDHYKTIDCIGLPDGYFADQVRLTREIDKETIIRMAAKYLDPAQMRIAVCR